tara:strand:- start:2319 stop:3416 length:1098 start_codon:yes stop_codon:yes gene_type:complete
MTFFSIAIPVFGQQKYIPTALKSIQAQNVEYELAVMDATYDNSVQVILDQYSDIITYRRHGPDGGQSEAIIEGWDNTNGEVLAWLCADDYYFPDTLLLVQEIFERSPDVDVVYGDSVYVDSSDCFKSYFPSIERDLSCLPIHDCIAQPSCFVRRKAFERVGGLNKDLCFIMDWDLWTRLYKSGATFRYIHKPLSVTRIYPETKTSAMSLERYREINAHLKQHASLLQRIRALIGTIQQSLSENDRSLLMNIVFTMINISQRIKNLVFPCKSKNLYGMEIKGNYVYDSCSISLPWYDTKPPKYAVLTTHHNISATLFLDGNPLVLQKSNDEQLFLLPSLLGNELKITWNFEIYVEQPTRLMSFKLV